MSVAVTNRTFWLLLITCITSIMLLSVQAEDPKQEHSESEEPHPEVPKPKDPKSEVERVRGLIMPVEPKKICMLRKDYLCKWSYDSACSCVEMKKRKKSGHYIGLSFIRKIISLNKNDRSVETYE